MKEPEVISATQAELDELLALAKTSFPDKQYKLLEGVLGTFSYLMIKIQNVKTSIKRLNQTLFGARTESKRNLLKDGGSSPAAAATVNAGTVPADGNANGNGNANADGDGNGDDGKTPPAKPKPPGHGRNGADAYSGAPTVELALTDLKSGDPCPQCETGKVYDSPPKTVVKVIGQAPLGATVYRQQRLRCRLCDAIFTAPLPAGVAEVPKYDHSCASMIALLRYGAGVPHFRLEGLQASLYVPLPDATQWDIIHKAVPAPRAVVKELIHQCAQAPLLYVDDTPMKVTKLMTERTRAEAAGLEPVAKAINTTGIVADLQHHKAVVFVTGHDHAGQNLAKVLAHRAQELEPPMQMCDALAANIPANFTTVLCNCLTHARRGVVDVLEHFPESARHVIEVLAKVYAHDAKCRQDKLSAEQRLKFHQDHSGPPMKGLHDWMTEQFEKRLVEPNSSLGKALNYLLKRWEHLTLFLRRAGAPLDNNLCERALKRAILHRKNSMFYKTLNGAAIGDIYMSVIHTCALCDVNAFEYLQALQRNAAAVQAQAALWLPWNYHEQLTHAA